MKNLKYNKKIIFKVCSAMFILFALLVTLILVLDNTSKTVATSTFNDNNTEPNIIVVDLKNNSATNEEEIPTIVTDDKASDKELKEEKVTKKEEQKSNSPYYIKVNYKANVVTIYKKDANDKYTIPYKAMVCSCGTATPRSGTYKTSSKYRWGKLIHDVYGQYATRIVGSILFHSVPYSSNTNDSLLYNQYDKLGTKASAGCIRLTVADAKWIYDNCPKGTMVEFYSSADPGPLGKPTAQKIAAVEECRNWDPTDPAEGNPWHTYVPDTPTTDESTTDIPSTDLPSTDEPTTDTPTTDVPSTDEPTTDTPTTDVPSTNEPTTDTSTTDVPSTDEPTTDTPTTDMPSTNEPTTDTPTTNVPSTDEPTIDTPTTDVPNTDEPTADTPNTDIPTTDATGTTTPPIDDNV